MNTATSPRNPFIDLPSVVLRNIISYLDVGHVICLAQIPNHRLRHILTVEFNGVWLKLLRCRLHIAVPQRLQKKAYTEAVRHAKSKRCSSCSRMELWKEPCMSGFWRQPLCDSCQFVNQHRLITTFTATHNYCLNKNHLLDLKRVSEENLHKRNGPHTRRFSRVTVQQKHRQILKERNQTEAQWLALRNARSARAKQSWIDRVAQKRRDIRQILATAGFADAATHNCFAVDAFARNKYRNYAIRKRWSVEDVLQNCLGRHVAILVD